MTQQTMTEQELFRAAGSNYQHLVNICERLELDGYWEQPRKILKQPVLMTLTIYVQSVLLLYAVYAHCMTPQIRLWLQKIAGEDAIRIADIDTDESVLKMARKITYSPPILLQLCGVADREQGTDSACIFLDSMLNLILVIACQAGSGIRDFTKFIQEYYQHIHVFLNQDTAENKMNARYLFRKLSCERIEDSLCLYIEDKKREERRRKMKEDLERLELSGNRRRKTYLSTGEEEMEPEADPFEVPVSSDGVVWEQAEEEERDEGEPEEIVTEQNKQEEKQVPPVLFEKAVEQIDTLNVNGLWANPRIKGKAAVTKAVLKKGRRELLELEEVIEPQPEEGKGENSAGASRQGAELEIAGRKNEEDQGMILEVLDGKTQEGCEITQPEEKKLEEQIPDMEAIKKGFSSLKAKMESARSRELDNLLEELNSLIGLESVKDEINSLINLIKIRKMREQYGMPMMDMTYHMVFTGSPGTGKTTVARLIAKIYKELGILSKGELVETDRSGLVAGYIGQTAIKVKEVVESALGGVLFIDEAYSLTGGNRAEDFGSEVIDTLVKLMEDHRDDLVVIVAGYTAEMKEFLKSNSGLVSRFNKFIEFKDYTDMELLDILDSMAKKAGFHLGSGAREQIGGQLGSMTEQKRRDFGNARGIRNVFEKIVVNQANRLVGEKNPTKEDLAMLIEEDVYHVIL